jgi:hypothetical protein
MIGQVRDVANSDNLLNYVESAREFQLGAQAVKRLNIHVTCEFGEAKFLIEPVAYRMG